MAREKGKGGLRHRQMQKTLAEYFIKQGKTAIIEAFIGRNVDLLVSDNSKIIAIEVQLSTKHWFQIIEDYRLGCNEVWVVCESARTLSSIKDHLRSSLSKRLFAKTRFRNISEFV